MIKNILKENIGFIIIAVAFLYFFCCFFAPISMGRIMDSIFNVYFLPVYIFEIFIIVGLILVLKNFFDFLTENKKIGKKVSKLSIISFICSVISFVFTLVLPITICVIEELRFFNFQRISDIIGDMIFNNMEMFIIFALLLFFASIILGIEAIREINKHKERLFEKKLVKKSFILILLLSLPLAILGISGAFSSKSTPPGNIIRKSDMRDIIIAQEIYYGANGAYFTAPFSNTGTHTIPGCLDKRQEGRENHPNYVWLKNDGDVSDCIMGEYFCVYATLRGKPIKYYAASERGTKEVDFIPGSIGGAYGIDHCSCYGVRKEIEISNEKTAVTEIEAETEKPEEQTILERNSEKAIGLSENATKCLENLKKNENNIISDDGLSPDGKKLIFMQIWRPIPDVNERPNMRVINTETCEDIYKKNWMCVAGDNISDISWSSDSEKAAIAMYTGRGWSGKFVIISLKDGEEKTIFFYSEQADYNSYSSSSFSPDGTKVLFVGHRAYRQSGTIYLVNADGTNLKTFTSSEKIEWSPVWSHNGTKIVYVTNPSYEKIDGIWKYDTEIKDEIWIMNLDGSDKKFLAKGNDPYLYIEK